MRSGVRRRFLSCVVYEPRVSRTVPAPNGTVVCLTAATPLRWRIRVVFQDVPGFLHELVIVAAAFENAGFDAAGTVGDHALGDLGQQREAVVHDVLRRDPAARQASPCGVKILARSREANLARTLMMQECRSRRRRANQVIGQQRRPLFPPHHLRRLAAHVIQIQVLLDGADVEFRVPAKAVQRGEAARRRPSGENA